MTSGEAMVKEIYRAFNNQDLDGVLEHFSYDAVMEHQTTQRTFSGIDELQQALIFWPEYFSGARVDEASITIRAMRATDLVQHDADEGYVAHFDGLGTLSRELLLPGNTVLSPTGRQVRIPITERLWLRDGEIVYATNKFDTRALRD